MRSTCNCLLYFHNNNNNSNIEVCLKGTDVELLLKNPIRLGQVGNDYLLATCS